MSDKFGIEFLLSEIRSMLDFMGEVRFRYCKSRSCDDCPIKGQDGEKCPFDAAISNLVEVRERIPDEEEE